METQDHLRAAQEETKACLWRMVRKMGLKLEAEQHKIMIVETKNFELKKWVKELEIWKMVMVMGFIGSILLVFKRMDAIHSVLHLILVSFIYFSCRYLNLLVIYLSLWFCVETFQVFQALNFSSGMAHMQSSRKRLQQLVNSTTLHYRGMQVGKNHNTS